MQRPLTTAASKFLSGRQIEGPRHPDDPSLPHPTLEPRPQNREDVDRLGHLLSKWGAAMINNEVGTGKTVQALLMI